MKKPQNNLQTAEDFVGGYMYNHTGSYRTAHDIAPILVAYAEIFQMDEGNLERVDKAVKDALPR